MKKTIEECLLTAGELLKESFGKIQTVALKQDQSNIVTQADLDAEYEILRIIERDFPLHSTLAEETGYKDRNSPYCWIIDPLDGTSNFASKIPWFGVLIAVLKNHEPIAAGMYLPKTEALYFAEKGKGATLNNETIHVSNEEDLKKLLFSYCLDFSADFGKTDFETRIIGGLVRQIRNMRATNSVTDFCYVADGKLGGCINQTTKIWDIAAPALIISEAGGKVTDINGDALNFKFDQNDYNRNFTFVGANPAIHAKAMQIVKEAR